jgi:hypothetical protein
MLENKKILEIQWTPRKKKKFNTIYDCKTLKESVLHKVTHLFLSSSKYSMVVGWISSESENSEQK